MKRILLFAACACFCMTACQTSMDSASESETGSLLVSLTTAGSPAVKSVTDVVGKESYLKDVQVFIFKTDGSLYQREVFPENTAVQAISGVKSGYYKLAAVANAPALTSIQTQSELEQQAIALSLNDPQVGFLMYGATENTVMVSGSNDAPASVTIDLTRYVSRVRLTSVQNNLPSDCGSLKVEGVFLENGMGSWTLLASAAPTAYVNYAGRKTGKNTSTRDVDFITIAADAESAALTFQEIDKNVSRSETAESFNLPLYTFPNPLAMSDDHFGATAESSCARLVLRASYGSPAESWYYPVTIPSMERNTSYDVSFVISGPGSKDPNQQVSNGNLSVEVRVIAWREGASYSGDF